MDNIGRREVLLGGGTLAAGLALGTQSSGVLGKEFLENIDKNTVETQAERLRERLLRSEDVLSEVELSTPQRIDAYEYNTNKNSTDSKVTDKGVKITDNFYLSSFDGDILQGEVDGYSYTYHYLEGADSEDTHTEDVKNLLDVTNDGYQDIVFSGDGSSGELGRINSVLEEFNEVRPFTRIKDQKPFLTEESIKELEKVKENTEDAIKEYTEFLNSYEGSPSQIYESSTNLIQQLEIAETATHRRIPLVGAVTGRSYDHNRFSVEEKNKLVEGKEEYENTGLRSTQERSEDLILEASLRVGKALAVQKTIEDALKYAEENDVIYDSVEDADRQEDTDKSYTEILDDDSQEVVETYFSDAEFELGGFGAEKIYLDEHEHAELRIDGYENPLRLTESNSFSEDEISSLKQYQDQLGTVFEEIIR